MKLLNVLLGAIVIVLAVAAPPALLGSLLAASAGALLVASAALQVEAVPAVLPTPVVQVVRVVPELRVFELDQGAGVVVFRTVNGKLTSRFYRA